MVSHVCHRKKSSKVVFGLLESKERTIPCSYRTLQMSILCPFGCSEERNNQKSVPHFVKDHRHELLEAIQPSGTLYSCIKSKVEGEPEICCCFGCNTAWKNKTVAARHFHDDKGKECLIRHRAFLAQLKQDANLTSMEDIMIQLEQARKETKAAKSKIQDLQIELINLRENADPQAKEACREITYLRQYIEQFGDLVFYTIGELLTEEQHKEMCIIDNLNCKELDGEQRKPIAEKLKSLYYTHHVVKLKWFPSLDTYLQMKKSEGVCHSEYTPWTRINVLRNWYPKFY